MNNRILVNKNGVEEEVTVIGSFELENKNEYLMYHSNDDELQVSKINKTNNMTILEDVPFEDETNVTEMIDSILEGI